MAGGQLLPDGHLDGLEESGGEGVGRPHQQEQHHPLVHAVAALLRHTQAVCHLTEGVHCVAETCWCCYCHFYLYTHIFVIVLFSLMLLFLL